MNGRVSHTGACVMLVLVVTEYRIIKRSKVYEPYMTQVLKGWVRKQITYWRLSVVSAMHRASRTHQEYKKIKLICTIYQSWYKSMYNGTTEG